MDDKKNPKGGIHKLSISELKKGQSVPALSEQTDTKVYQAIRSALEDARAKVIKAVNSSMVGVYWEIGRQINEAIGERAEYGHRLLSFLSERLTGEFGKGFTVRNLRAMRQFYQTFPIRHALRAELTWTHYRMLMRGGNGE